MLRDQFEDEDDDDYEDDFATSARSEPRSESGIRAISSLTDRRLRKQSEGDQIW